MARVVVYVESSPCGGLANVGDVFVKFTRGSRGRAFRRSGVPDDDLDFAVRFLETCRVRRARVCVAVVRDDRIAKLIARLLAGRYRGLDADVEVYMLRSFLEPRDEVCKEVKHIIERICDCPCRSTQGSGRCDVADKAYAAN